MKPHERDLLEAMFAGSSQSVELSDLKNRFYKHVPDLRNGLYKGLVSDGFYTARPDRVRLLYMAGGADEDVTYSEGRLEDQRFEARPGWRYGSMRPK